MADLVLASVEYGGYISLFKLVVFLILFFAWLPLVKWVYSDANALGTKEGFWVALVFGAGAVSVATWLLMPAFTVGLLAYLIILTAASLSYVIHRNARVPAFNRVLTVEHIKGLFSNESKKVSQMDNVCFITANNNEVPVPDAKTPDFFGYQAAYKILDDASRRRVSNIIFTPGSANYSVNYVIDGAAVEQPSLPNDQANYFTLFIKGLSGLDTEEKRKPQKGRFRIGFDNEFSEWEVTTSGSTVGERVKLKHLTKENVIRLTDINLTEEQYMQLNKLCHAKEGGVFIISGPRQSGVTTTFYALMRNHDPFIYGINTLERRPSAELKNITQNVYSLSDTGTVSYAKKLQTMVRMEPDVVGVGDCQDTETARVICKAAKAGRIIYVVLEADNAIKAIAKWFKFVRDRKLAIGTLRGISNQRLLRKLCKKCKQGYEPNKELLRKFNIPADKIDALYRSSDAYYDKRGKPRPCDNCQGTGYVGRMGVFEVIMMNDKLRAAVAQSKSLSDINTHFRRAKMEYLQEQALKHVVAGKTSINEMVRILAGAENKKKKPSKGQ